VADGRVGADEYGPALDVTFTGGRNPGRLLSGLDARDKSPQDLSLRLSAAHTAVALYVACEVRDQFVRADPSAAKTPWYNDSVVSPYIGGEDFWPVDLALEPAGRGSAPTNGTR
jgi:hypothetical protein